MKKLLALIVFIFITGITTQAQTFHNVDGKEVELSEEITGKVTLYYAVIDSNYRYFVKKNEEITELTNTKNDAGKYQEEYKEILKIITAEADNLSTKDLKLTLASLRSFIDSYNKAVDQNYRMTANRPKPKSRLGAFGGISNVPFVNNPDNTIVPTFGLDFEVYDVKASRHSIALGFKQSLKGSDFDYTSSQFSIGYRFRIINKTSFALYPQATLAVYDISSNTTVVNGTKVSTSGSGFEAPIILGIGSDIKLGNGFITISANELVALVNLKNQGNFPVDLRLGYKFNL